MASAIESVKSYFPKDEQVSTGAKYIKYAALGTAALVLLNVPTFVFLGAAGIGFCGRFVQELNSANLAGKASEEVPAGNIFEQTSQKIKHLIQTSNTFAKIGKDSLITGLKLGAAVAAIYTGLTFTLITGAVYLAANEIQNRYSAPAVPPRDLPLAQAVAE